MGQKRTQDGRARKEPTERALQRARNKVSKVKNGQLRLLTKETQDVTITDCHASNPCELEIDLTAKSSSPIIEGMYGQDWKERAET
ncbi:hypothetical protein Tco_1533098 [Tanacetum coccineum]